MPLSVIIVDDHAPMREMLATVFTRAGADVREAASGAAALALYEDAQADLVVMDQSMPGLSGVALIERLRAHSQSVRLILVSGHKSAALTAEARAAGADAVLAKPISPRALMETVNTLMAAARGC